ncbi:hypothetical protein HBI81_222110 [Parastagonospora nodorum]|nr:hypothetical protein HBH49_123650 [Parastagonospora nodorum]KAH4088523.1 hypothetical protein HBH46_195970 [Parastagonospora nodorum]KAH5502386.1 hypothetical protein HBI29_145910 [Parastagonospora nodorum]KAH6020869.1 hypothetical protein HBI83_103970 [Parastagonospora nodorum]KAH6097400.1 hypothetical protein HBI65_085860 [Parastagonospora nodorum]
MKEHEYLALSYTWGVESPTYPIVIDGKEFRVRENLWWFLSYVASGRLPYHSNADTGTSCYIWIDQICISQSSKKEKNHQVSMMSDIYRGAKEVVAWMGRETEKSLDCMQFLEQAADVFHAQLRDAQYEVLDPHLRFNLRFRNALDVLCRQPYWGRIWIIQEFAMAHRWRMWIDLIMFSTGSANSGEKLLQLDVMDWTYRLWSFVYDSEISLAQTYATPSMLCLASSIQGNALQSTTTDAYRIFSGTQ